MEKLTLKAYAVKHKLSIFNVVKLVKSGKLKSVTENENGKDVTYILLEKETGLEIKKGIVPLEDKRQLSLEKEIYLLKKELAFMRKEIEALKNRL